MSSSPGCPDWLDAVLADATALTARRIAECLPRTSPTVRAWIDTLTHGSGHGYFCHPRAFPTLLLPAWLDEALGGTGEKQLHRDLCYSSMQGYYAIRLLDDIMDGEAPQTTGLLPAALYFQCEFQTTYTRWFPADHPFWREFRRHWYHTKDAAIADADLEDIDNTTFHNVAAMKVRAALIPLAAVAYRRTNASTPAPWIQFFDCLAEWHQFRNDFRDWARDLARGAPTYVLCEARRLGVPGETTPAWMAREGLTWGVEQLASRLETVRASAARLDSPGVIEYLDAQHAHQASLAETVARGITVATTLLAMGAGP